MKGLFIALEGIDGSGKSSAMAFIRQFLEDAKVPSKFTREPGGTPAAEKIRDLVLWGTNEHTDDFSNWAEACLYNASRSTHLQNMVLPSIEDGYFVVSDRFCDSTFAHQGGGRNLSLDDLKTLHRIVCWDIKPDVTFLLDGDPLMVRKRMSDQGRKFDRLEQQPIEFQYKSRAIHLQMMEEDPERYILIDAEQNQESVQAQLIPHLMAIINKYRQRITV